SVPAATKAWTVESAAVRIGGVLVARRYQTPEIAQYLNDPDPRIVLEAARAINDVPIDGATGALSALATRSNGIGDGKVRDLILARALNANFRTGTAASAAVLVQCAQRPDLSDTLR